MFRKMRMHLIESSDIYQLLTSEQQNIYAVEREAFK